MVSRADRLEKAAALARAEMVSRADRLEKAAALARAEVDFVAAKAVGQEKRDAALDKAYAGAKSRGAYEKAKAKVPPAVSAEAKAAFHAIRAEYRTKYRGPPKDGGAQAGGLNAKGKVNS